MQKTFSIVCATKNKESTSDRWTGQIIYTKWELPLTNIKDELCKYDTYIEYQNTKGLGEVYNKYFDKLDTDYVICIHDDVRIDDIQFFDKITDYSKDYDIMGVAGGCNFSFKRHERLSWMSVLNQQTDLAGVVQHRMSKEGETPEIFSSCNYGPIPKKVFSIDGLIMIFNKKAYKSIKFDPKFTFDFYDLDLCFTAYKAGLTVGVIPLSVTHFSKGEGILKEEYLRVQNIFKDKWLK